MTEIDNVRIIKNAGETRRASVAGRRLATPLRKGVMRMGHKGRVCALRFALCVIVVFLIAVALAPKAC